MKNLLLVVTATVLLGCTAGSDWSCKPGDSVNLIDFVPTPRKGASKTDHGLSTFSVSPVSHAGQIVFDLHNGERFNLRNMEITFDNLKRISIRYHLEDTCVELKVKSYDVTDKTHLNVTWEEPKTMDSFFLRVVPDNHDVVTSFTVDNLEGCRLGNM